MYLKGGTRVGSTVITDNQWHHIAVVLPDKDNPEATDIDIYIDGVLEISSTPTTIAINTGYAEDVHIGKAYWDDSFQQGYIDDVRIYGYALTEAEILGLYNSPSDDIITYDDCGGMTFDGSREYGYDISGRISMIGDTEYKYDAANSTAHFAGMQPIRAVDVNRR